MADSYIGLPNDGSGKRLATKENNGLHKQVFTIGDADNNYTQSVDKYGAATVTFQGGGFDFDSFGKAKVSEETVLSSFIPEFDEEPTKFRVETEGTSELVYVPNEKSVKLKVDTTEGDRVVRTSHRYHKYIAGVSNTTIMTVNPSESKDGVVKRWGLFDDNNGIFFEIDGHDGYLVIRSNVSGTPVDKRIGWADWNGDKMDGQGLSGITMGFAKSNIYWIDFQWLGVGMVQWGIMHPNGTKILIHTEENANKYSTVYMGSANLPIRHEIFNKAGTASASEMRIHNSVVLMNEANPAFEGKRFVAGKGMNDDKIHITNDWKILIIARQKDEFKGKPNHSAAMLKSINLYCNKPMVLSIQRGTTTEDDEHYGNIDPESTVEIAADATLKTHGVRLHNRLIPAGIHTIDIVDEFDYLSECLQQGPKELSYSILARTVDKDDEDDIMVGLQWEELRMA